MKKMIFVALVVTGVWWYAGNRFDFKDTLKTPFLLGPRSSLAKQLTF